MEAENKEIIELEEEIVDNLDFGSKEVQALIERFERREINLSPSSLRQFCKSPRHLLAYKLKQFKKTPAMVFGDLVDCLRTCPHLFDAKFYMPPVGAKLTSADGCKLWLTLWGVPPGNWTFAELKALVLELMEKETRSKITPQLLAEAKELNEKMGRNQPFYHSFEEATSWQGKVEYDFCDWKIIGYYDLAKPTDWLGDLKMAPSTDERKIAFKIRDELLIQQLCLYAYGLDTWEARLLFFDRTRHFRALRVGEADLRHGLKRVEEVIGKLEDCIFAGDWEKSHDFWSPNWDGFYSY